MKSILVLMLAFVLVSPPLPAIEQPVVPDAPKDFENGLKITLEAIKELGQVDDPAQVARVNEIGYRVAQRAAPGMPYFSFRIVKMEEPNAFALPGGFIFITTGMLDLNLTDDELAALLGHEITHVKNGHMRRMSRRQTLMNLLYQALILGIAFGIKEDSRGYDPVTGYPLRSAKSEILQGSAAFGLVFQELLLRGFSRELEIEADEGGMIAAAGAGFSPQGTSSLFDKMRRRIYEAPGFGYWRTHPYLDDRVATARVLSSNLQISKSPPNPQLFQEKTQQLFLDLLPRQKDEPSKLELRQMALHANPAGKNAEELRKWFINKAESEEMVKEPFFRDYGKIIKLYDRNIEDTQKDKSGADFTVTLESSLQKIWKDRDSALPMYEEVLNKQAYDTEMLKRFISNYPESPRLPEIRFHLAENYRILKKSGEAVDLYLEVLKTESGGEWNQKSRQSLLQMLPGLEDLSACYRASLQSKDPELQAAAKEQLKTAAQSFKSLQNGYEFRRSHPGSDYEKPVLARLAKLADETLHQGRLYQAIGEYQKALDQYNLILRYCSDLPVADQVRDTIVDFQELQSVKS